MKRLVILIAFAGSLSCHVNEYCLDCEQRDGGTGDGGGDDGGDGGGGDDAGDGGNCIPTGTEVCDGKDNDCDGNTDEAPLPEIGDPCGSGIGECAGATKACVNGAVVCSKNPTPEVCDGKDNDCNGLTDEGDPGGGAKCGTDVGECVAGTFHCNLTTHVVECIGAIGTVGGQPEQCNGRDDDCDGNFDEGLGSLGSCGGGPGADPNAGECQQGTLVCVGGGTVCTGDTGPAFEACDNKDNDCDGSTDEDTNKATDPQNCGFCGNVCNLPHAFEGCSGGNCTIAACEQTFHDANGITGDGCEYGPCTIQGNEVCNGNDDDCDAKTDESLVPPPNFCLTQGACAGATASCQGANGFRCNYGPDVSQDANGNVVPETACDGVDNDCDGAVDEGQPNLGQACSDNGVGVCHGTGTFQCNAANPTGPAICVITNPGLPPSGEACDAKDNDCDGKTDEGANTGNLIGQDWVTIPNSSPAVQIMKWEASRPDASATGGGTNQTFACSKQGVQPWTNITAPQAAAACTSVGARLCSEAEWQKMCDPAPAYPIAGPTGTDFAFADAEAAFAITAGDSLAGNDVWQFRTRAQEPALQDFSGSGAMRALLDNGTTVSGPNAPLHSPRLDFQFSLAASTQYVVWVRMMGIAAAGDSIHLGLNQTPPGTVNAGSFIVSPLNVWVWVKGTAVATGAAGTYTASVYMNEDGVFVDAVAVSLASNPNTPPFDDRTWATQNRPKVAQPGICNGDDLDTNAAQAGDQDDILATGSLGQCFANGAGASDAFDMSGNVKEWAAPRAAGQNPLRGGASNNELDGLTCGLDFTLADNTFFFPNVGFRCCR